MWLCIVMIQSVEKTLKTSEGLQCHGSSVHVLTITSY